MPQTNHMETLTIFEYIYRGWPILLAILGFIAWLLRVEAKVVYLERYTRELSEQVTRRDTAMWQALNSMQKDIRDILQHLAKIEGKLEGSNSKNQ